MLTIMLVIVVYVGVKMVNQRKVLNVPKTGLLDVLNVLSVINYRMENVSLIHTMR